MPLVRAACRTGAVTLAAGRTSDFYVDGKQVTLSPAGAYWFGVWILQTLADADITALGGPSIGADPITGAVVTLGHQSGRPLRGFLVRPAPKAHGLRRQIEGPLERGDRVTVVEDVVTTGRSLLQAIAAVEAAGAQVVRVLALVDRGEGGATALRAAGYEFEAVFTRADLTEAGAPPPPP